MLKPKVEVKRIGGSLCVLIFVGKFTVRVKQLTESLDEVYSHKTTENSSQALKSSETGKSPECSRTCVLFI